VPARPACQHPRRAAPLSLTHSRTPLLPSGPLLPGPTCQSLSRRITTPRRSPLFAEQFRRSRPPAGGRCWPSCMVDRCAGPLSLLLLPHAAPGHIDGSVLLSFSCSCFACKFNYVQRSPSIVTAVANGCGPVVSPKTGRRLGSPPREQ
jgi:hypothetical protein